MEMQYDARWRHDVDLVQEDYRDWIHDDFVRRRYRRGGRAPEDLVFELASCLDDNLLSTIGLCICFFVMGLIVPLFCFVAASNWSNECPHGDIMLKPWLFAYGITYIPIMICLAPLKTSGTCIEEPGFHYSDQWQFLSIFWGACGCCSFLLHMVWSLTLNVWGWIALLETNERCIPPHGISPRVVTLIILIISPICCIGSCFGMLNLTLTWMLRVV